MIVALIDQVVPIDEVVEDGVGQFVALIEDDHRISSP